MAYSSASSLPKDMQAEMAAAYKPKDVEAKWYEWWEQNGFFKPHGLENSQKFVIVLPPPNVTGTLHLGHTLTAAVEDCLVRWHRMLGHDTLWVPGTDHAGIATQVVVEKKLKKEEGKSRLDYGREEFLKKVFEWKDVHAGVIQKQQRLLGASLDWSREVFTMDEQRCRAVTEAFVRLFDQGLIYRSTRLVNWCPALRTAISDMEVDYVDVEKREKIRVPGYQKPVEFGILCSFAYKVDGSEEEIVVATTRPETMLGDTAVAVHPEDPRYKHLHGKLLVHPFNGRRIPVIADSELVDMTFGTGAVKVTPAHDPNDFTCGRRHGLPEISVFSDDGMINENGTPFVGMKRFECRDAVMKGLEAKGLLRGVDGHVMRLGLCSRSGDVVEPMVKPQWFCDCKKLAERAVNASKSQDLEIFPEWQRDTWYRWLENIHDWCISRQLWWGHRIPAYEVKTRGTSANGAGPIYVAGRSDAEAHQKAADLLRQKGLPDGDGDFTLEQDHDVLDTWFSSGLHPFSVMGWPEQTADMKRYFPGQLLETGHDILFFWVARMVMMSLALTDELPFSQVFLHAMVRDKNGRKMSKSLGNVIDPLDVIAGITLEDLHRKLEQGNLDPREVERAKKGQKEQFPDGIPECGSDALRFTLLNYMQQARDINLDIQRVVGYRQWCNKLWNATKFALLNVVGFRPSRDMLSSAVVLESLSFADRWILSRLSHAVELTNVHLEAYDFGAATAAIFDFWLYEFCDYYLELSKPIYRSGTEAQKYAAQCVLFTCLETALRLTHPFMPFVTEELWHRLPSIEEYAAPDRALSIMVQSYPVSLDFRNVAVEEDMKLLQDVIHACRSIRMSYSLTTQRPDLYAKIRGSEQIVRLIRSQTGDLQFLGQVGTVHVVTEEETHKDSIPSGCAVQVLNDKLEIHMMLRGFIDVSKEMARVNKKIGEIAKGKETLSKRMSDASYATKVPEHIRAGNADQMSKYNEELTALNKALEDLKLF